MGEARQSVLIVNQRGLHARASAKFVGMVAGLPAGLKVTVSKAPHSAAGGSILGLMMLGAAKGDTVEVAVEGENAETVLAELVALVASGFGED
ncbi:MAG TPA: HPr family phosphocarrier protein [Erythrobacter sp.]|nr:HPr family phosphocarrier protein [Erythrobacter sp.]